MAQNGRRAGGPAADERASRAHSPLCMFINVCVRHGLMDACTHIDLIHARVHPVVKSRGVDSPNQIVPNVYCNSA